MGLRSGKRRTLQGELVRDRQLASDVMDKRGAAR
jgi:hypothetical protein